MNLKTKKIGICAHCGRNYNKATIAQKYCCRMCRVAAENNEELPKSICPGCGTEFTVQKKNAVYCKPECRIVHDEKKRTYNVSGVWAMISELILERDSYVCKKCGVIGVKLVVHHILPLCKGGDNSMSNLITICEKCHGNEHKKLMDIYRGQ
jgi:5-methylcytosine-specific restriction endonuclease McrA